MHVRFSMVRGTPVVDEQTQQPLGMLEGVLVHPDTGAVLGFFVYGIGYLEGQQLFLASSDILSWGTRVHIRSEDRLSPPDELVRLQSLLQSPRTVLGQKIIIKKTRVVVGTCVDIQFDTRHFQIEWLFPKKWFVERRAVAASDIVEITNAAILISEPLRPRRELAKELAEAPVKILEEVVAPPVPSTRSAS